MSSDQGEGGWRICAQQLWRVLAKEYAQSLMFTYRRCVLLRAVYVGTTLVLVFNCGQLDHTHLQENALGTGNDDTQTPLSVHLPLLLLFPVSIIHTDLKPENVLLDLPPRPPPESEQPPPLQGRVPKVGAAMKGVAATIEDLSTALSLAGEHGLTAEEKRKLKKKVRGASNLPRFI